MLFLFVNNRFFVLKTDPHLNQILATEIEASALSFFKDLTSELFSYISKDELNNQLLKSKGFQSFFFEFIRNNNVVEYYLVDANTTFLMIDDKGRSLGFFAKTTEQIQSDIELIEDEMMPSITDGGKMLCFCVNDGELYPDDLSPYLYPCHSVNAEFCYAITDISALNIQ